MLFARTIRALGVVGVSVTMVGASLSIPVQAHAATPVSLGTAGSVALQTGPVVDVPLLFKKKKKKKKRGKKRSKPKGPRLTPESAEEKRAAIRSAAQPDLDAQRYGAAAEKLEENAAILGDPLTFMDAADAWYELAKRDRSIDYAERSIETSKVALDILHHYSAVASGEVESDWLVIDPGEADPLMARAAEQMASAESLIEEIEAEQQASDEPVADAGAITKKKDKKKRERKPGAGMIAAGSAFTALGVGGVSMLIAGVAIGASKQNKVEELDPVADADEIDRLDKEGGRANVITYVGAGIAVAGLAVGIPLLVFGIKKRKEDKSPPKNAQLRVLPALGRSMQGIAVSGRF